MPEFWMVNQYAITPDLPGGTRHYDYASELAKRGHNVKVFASDVNLALRKHTKLEKGEIFKSEYIDGVEFIWVHAATYYRNDWKRAWSMLRFSYNFLRVENMFSKGTNKPQAIIGSSPHPFAALAAQIAAQKTKARFILELRDLWPQALVDMGGFKESHPAIRGMRLIENYLYRKADKIIVLAEGSISYLEERGIARNRIVFVPNGVHLKNFQPTITREDARRKYHFDKFSIVYTGAHGPANSLDTVLLTADLLRSYPINFVFIGDGPAKEGLRQQSEQMKLSNVRFIDPVPKAEIPNILIAADACLIALKNVKAFEYAISPNKLFDYFAASKPVICCVPGDIGNLVRTSGTGYSCEPGNHVQLAETVLKIYKTNEEQLNAMGILGRHLVAQRFSREVSVQKLEEVLCGVS
ncbi:MAG: glycosyltransferase family 4 protein [Bacillota bacterium]